MVPHGRRDLPAQFIGWFSACGIYAPGEEWVPQAGERKKGGDARY